ncbi:MAG: OmpA family protein [Stenotrophobium sp.]
MLRHKILAVACLFATSAVFAQSKDDVVDTRWYVSPSIGAVFAGSGNPSFGPQGSISVGRSITEYQGIEIEGGYSSLNVTHLPSENKYQRAVLGVNLLQYLAPQKSDIRPYLLLNANGHSIRFLGESLTGAGVGAGLGTFLKLSSNWDMRLEGRYNLDFIGQKGIVQSQTFYVWTAGLGFRYKFGAVPGSEAPVTHPPEVVHVVQPPPPPPPVTLKCPNTPAGIPVGPDGCPLDSDGDGVPDYLDECPHTPAGAKVLPNGCALKGDCRTPKPGEAVDANGCAASHNFILKGVKFEFASNRLTEEAKLILNQVAETLKAYPDVDVDVEGHTDYIGSDAYNMGLSERRADAVKDYLMSHGVNGKRMTPIGYGKTRPIDTNLTEAGRENNRRVELHVKD